MTPAELINQAQHYGARLLIVGGKLAVAPPGRVPPDLKSRLREHAPEIRALLTQPSPAAPEPSAADRAAWAREVTPNSRQPLIPPEVRRKIEGIEGEARRLGWPAELLWSAGFWDCPRGLAAVLDEDDQIGAVTPDFIEIVKMRRDLLRFQRRAA